MIGWSLLPSLGGPVRFRHNGQLEQADHREKMVGIVVNFFFRCGWLREGRLKMHTVIKYSPYPVVFGSVMMEKICSTSVAMLVSCFLFPEVKQQRLSVNMQILLFHFR